MSTLPLAPQPKEITLYSVADDIRALLDTSEGLQGEELEVFNREMQPVIERAVRKVDDFCRFLAHLESQAGLARAEEKRLADRRRSIEGLLERLESYAVNTLELAGLKKLEGDTSTLSLRAKPGAVEISDEIALPAEFIIVKQETQPDKRKIKAALEAGREVPGADLVFGGNSLVRR